MKREDHEDLHGEEEEEIRETKGKMRSASKKTRKGFFIGIFMRRRWWWWFRERRHQGRDDLYIYLQHKWSIFIFEVKSSVEKWWWCWWWSLKVQGKA